jgi:hypothetical protein
MSNSLFEHDFQVDLEPNENTYCTQDVQWQYINDNNSANYANGYINFTNLNLGGGSIDKMYSFSNAYLTIPYSIILSGDGTTFKFKVKDPANSFAACLKGNHTIVDWVSCKFDGTQLSRSSYHNHLMVNEKIKTYNSDKYKIYGDIMGHSWDNGYGINLTARGEVNNNINPIVPGTPPIFTGLTPSSQINTGHYQRCMKNNIDVTKKANSSLNTFLCKDDASANANLRDSMNQSVLVFSDADNLVFQGVATIPLSQLHDVFQQMPTISSVQGFDLRLQCNLARENVYTMTYPAIAAGSNSVDPSSITVVQSIGKCCVVMVANPSETGMSGLRVDGARLIGGQLKTQCIIGWNTDGLTVGNIFKGTTGNPCRIHLPTISFTSDYIKDIASAPQYSLKYNDYYVDSELNLTHGSTPSRLFNCNLSRPRTLYIIPFLASKPGTNYYPSALTSPLSSAPTTCTPCRLKNFNIQIGGQNLFSEPQQFNYSFYNSNAMSILADINGNSPKGALFSSQINKSQWENGYNVFYVNLQKASDIITDSTMKAFQLTYAFEGNNNEGNTSIAYDMYYIISYENELNLDRLTGKISGINQ